MLKKKYRLPAQIRNLKPLNTKDPFFKVRLTKNNLEHNRYGFIVSKKIDKRATHRNYMKRQMRNIAWEQNSFLKQGLDLLFTVSKPMPEDLFVENFKQLCDNLQRELEKTNL